MLLGIMIQLWLKDFAAHSDTFVADVFNVLPAKVIAVWFTRETCCGSLVADVGNVLLAMVKAMWPLENVDGCVGGGGGVGVSAERGGG